MKSLSPRTVSPPRRGRRGLTAIELMVVMTILLVAISAFSGTVASAFNQRGVNRENAIAATAAGNLLETMRDQDFAQLFALYNEDPADDPGGAGSAPGNRFAVDGLDPAPGAVGGAIGEVIFPTVAGELREDVADDRLGMPRDLDGDHVIDSADHAGDYFRLPVAIRLRWTGKAGVREMTVHSMLCVFEFGS